MTDAGQPQRRKRPKHRPVFYALATVAVLTVAGFAGVVVFVLWGVYNVSALQQHTEPVYLALDTALKRSISRRAESLEAPGLDDPEQIRTGLHYYRLTCVRCHGAPGVARDSIAKGMTPMPANLVNAARQRTPEEIFWAIKHGIKMTGMPAWRFEYDDQQIWAITAFVMQLPNLTVQDYARMNERAGDIIGEIAPTDESVRPGNPARGRLALHSYACVTCHTIPGVVGPEANVGPPLGGIAERSYIAGVLANDFDNLVRWIEDPVAVDPLTTMPDMGVNHQDAVDIATYLYNPD